MLFLLGGLAILSGVLLLGYLFVNTPPAQLARVLKWAGIVVGVLAIGALLFSGRLAMVLAPLAAILPMLHRMRSLFRGFRGPAAGKTSDVETVYLRMTLDHDTGNMTGTVLRGSFAGMQLGELAAADLLALLRECRTEDEDAARLLEAYLDRAQPDWRETMAGGRGNDAPPPSGSADVSVEEAYAILGLSRDADAKAIKAAHHRLMKHLHPDHGGSDYLATKINRARDVLLRRR